MYMYKHTMEFLVSFGMSIIQPLHLRLGDPLKRGITIVKAKRRGHMLLYSVAYVDMPGKLAWTTIQLSKLTA